MVGKEREEEALVARRKEFTLKSGDRHVGT